MIYVYTVPLSASFRILSGTFYLFGLYSNLNIFILRYADVAAGEAFDLRFWSSRTANRQVYNTMFSNVPSVAALHLLERHV